MASFMRMYPAYKLREVLTMPAITFLKLLNEGYGLQFTEYKMMAAIVSVPHLEDEARTKFMRDLEIASGSLNGILEPDVDETSEEALKELF